MPTSSKPDRDLNPQDGTVYIKELRFRGYKHFAPVELSLAPINLLLGDNAAGKTSFLKLIRFIDLLTKQRGLDIEKESEGLYHMFNHQYKNPISVECVTYNNQKINIDIPYENFILYGYDSIYIQTKNIDHYVHDKETNWVESNFHVDTFYYHPNVIQKVKQNKALKAAPNLYPDGSNAIHYLNYLQHEDNTRFQVINTLVSVAFPEVKEVIVEVNTDNAKLDVYYIAHNEERYPIEIWPDSLIHFLALITSITSPDYNIFLLDIPDYNLSQRAITVMDEAIRNRSRIAQFFLATNSSKLIKYFELKDIAVLNKNKNNGMTGIYQLTETQMTLLSVFSQNLNVYEMWEKRIIKAAILGDSNE